MNKLTEVLALEELDARLTEENPELAAALSFGRPRRSEPPVRRRNGRALVGAVSGLVLLMGLLFSLLTWGKPPTYCSRAQTPTTPPAATALHDHATPNAPAPLCRTAPARTGAQLYSGHP